MKILFVYTDINVRGGARSYQFGIGMISAMLRKHGHETGLHYMFDRYDTAPLQAELERYQPDVVAFSGVSPQYRYIKRVLSDLAPWKAFTIFGGIHPTVAPECIEEVPALNAICVGEGEHPMRELGERLQAGRPVDDIPNLWVRRADGSIARNPTRAFVENLDELPFPDRELFDYQGIVDSDFGTALFMFSRGCPYNCTFCSNHVIRARQCGQYVRFRSVDNCFAEIREVTSKYKTRQLYFNDDCFTAKLNFLRDFCARYPREFSLPFDVNARPETLNDEVCKLLASAGCRRVSIGIENGSEKFRDEVLGRRQKNERIVQAFDACRRTGLKTKSFNIVGFPYETPEIFQETIDLNARANPDSVILGIFEPYPGTKLYEICRQERFIDPAREETEFVGRTDTVLNMPQFPRQEILRCFRRFGYEVYRKHSLKKAMMYRIYYSRYGEPIIRLLQPVKDLLRRIAMGV